MNDDLVAKNFACYELGKANQRSASESLSEEKSPVMLLWPTLLRESTVSEMREYEKSVTQVIGE